MTLTEKILAHKAGKASISPGEIVSVEPDVFLTHDHQGSMAIREFEKFGLGRIRGPEKLVIVLDHRAPTQSVVAAENHQLLRKFARENEGVHFFDTGQGICHDILAEQGFVMPGRIVVGTDSHTVTHGAVGAFATGIGSSEMAAVWARGKL